jgi:hypothetical protein
MARVGSQGHMKEILIYSACNAHAHIIFSSVACLVVPYFFHIISQSGRFPGRKLSNIKLFVLVSPVTFSEISSRKGEFSGIL